MNQRYYSLDIFRGATVALMILVNNPGSWSHIYAPLEHAAWHGCTPTDLVFPFFLFAVGNALSFVMPRLQAAGTNAAGTNKALLKITKRALLIFAIGLFLNWSPFVKWNDAGGLVFKYWVDPVHPETGIRLLGVLQRIAICYLLASLIAYFLKQRGIIIVSIVLLAGYWALCRLSGNPADPYSLSGYFGTAVDKALLGIPHMYKGEGVPFDPEGLASTLPAIVQVLTGYLAGAYIQQKGKTYEMLAHLFIAAGLLIFAGFCWDLVFPINKKIWTSSYVLYAGGLATGILGLFIYYVEFKQWHQRRLVPATTANVLIMLAAVLATAMVTDLLTHHLFIPLLLAMLITGFFVWVLLTNQLSRFFEVFGKNALFIFVLSGFLPRIVALLRWTDHTDEQGHKVYTNAFAWFYEHGCKPVSENLKNGSLLYALCTILFFWAIVYWLDKKRIYIKV